MCKCLKFFTRRTASKATSEKWPNKNSSKGGDQVSELTQTNPNPLHKLKIDSYLDSPDKRPRKEPIVMIVVHHTGIGNRGGISDPSLWRKLNVNIAKWLATADPYYVSAHYQIGRYKELTQIVEPEEFVAYHAGKSSFWHPIDRKWRKGCNEFALGIELLGDGNKEPYSEEQYEKLAEVCKAHMKYWNIPANMIVGHEMIAPKRKQDPGKYFSWEKFFNVLHS